MTDDVLVELAEPTEELSARGRSDARHRLGIATVVVVCIAAAAIPVTIRLTSKHQPHAVKRDATKHLNPNQARISVGDALAATLASHSYRISSLMTQTDPPGSTDRPGMTLSAQGTVNLDPQAMVAVANVQGVGPVTSWTNNESVWEQGGADYGLTARSGIGAGAPLSGFENLVQGTLGPREAGLAMMSFASPSGYFDLADKAITSASQVGTTSLNGSQLTEYEVTLDASQLLTQPGMTAEEVKAGDGGLALLHQEGYTDTTVRLGVDAAGFVRESVTTWHFSDGGTVATDVTYTDFGCAGTVVLPTQAPSSPPASTCTSPDPAATTPATVAAPTAP